MCDSGRQRGGARRAGWSWDPEDLDACPPLGTFSTLNLGSSSSLPQPLDFLVTLHLLSAEALPATYCALRMPFTTSPPPSSFPSLHFLCISHVINTILWSRRGYEIHRPLRSHPKNLSAISAPLQGNACQGRPLIGVQSSAQPNTKQAHSQLCP